VARKDQPAGAPTADVTVAPAYRADLGARMRMGEVVALRRGGPAEKAGVNAHADAPVARGDRIKMVKLPEPDGRQTWLTTGDDKAPDPKLVTVRKLDPVLLPLELRRWADRNSGERKLKLVVLRTVGHK